MIDTFVNLEEWIYTVDTVLKTDVKFAWQCNSSEFPIMKGFCYMAISVSGQD